MAELSELALWSARLIVLALMYVFLIAMVLAMRADLRAAGRTPASVPQVPAPRRGSGARRLVVTSGMEPASGGRFDLTGPMDIGRDDACDISIANQFISKRHARVFEEDGQWMVVDLGSTNGTLLNGELLTQPHPVSPGDTLVVGDTHFAVE